MRFSESSSLLKFGAVLLLLVGAVGVASAAPVTFNLNYVAIEGTGTAVGTFTIDDSLLAPDTQVDGLEYLLCFQVTIDVPGIPVQTFTRADLDGFVFNIGEGGVIYDVNFFMEGPCPIGQFLIDGVEPLWLGFFACTGGEPDGIIVFAADPTQGGVCAATSTVIPTLSPIGVAALVALLAGAALAVLRRGSTLF